MFDTEIKNISSILRKMLGDPKDEYSFDSWSHWNCPCCAEQKGVSSDMKFNLEINIRKNVYHCWVCGDTNGTKGRLSSLFKKYGSTDLYNEYINEINSIKQSNLYRFNKDEFDFDDFEFDNELYLPNGFKKINYTDYSSKKAYEYLTERGITKDIIEKFGIGYIGNEYNPDFFMKNRIVVPSYDKFNELNYWVARDYTNKSKLRYKNPLLEKTRFVFNEGKINWYEDITLVEGVFDHIVVPNSIPLLGKSLDTEYYLYSLLVEKSKSNINIFLDPDAKVNAVKIYKSLNSTKLKDRIRIINAPNDMDASDIFKIYGKKGVLSIMRTAKKLSDFELTLNF